MSGRITVFAARDPPSLSVRQWGRTPMRPKGDAVQGVGERKSSGGEGQSRKITCSHIDVEEIEWGGKTLRLETGRMARQADGAVLATYGETTVLATAVAERAGEARDRFLPAHRQLPGKDLCRRQDSRRLFQARRPADREGDAGLAPHRPADPAAVRRGLPQRDAGHRHRALL